MSPGRRPKMVDREPPKLPIVRRLCPRQATPTESDSADSNATENVQYPARAKRKSDSLVRVEQPTNILETFYH